MKHSYLILKRIAVTDKASEISSQVKQVQAKSDKPQTEFASCD